MSDYARRKGAERSFASRSPQESDNAWNGGILAGFCAIAVALGTLGCGDGEDTGAPTNVRARGELVSVAAGETSVGFSHGTARVAEKTLAFKISKSPITKKQYEKCEKAGICKAPKVDECSDPALAKASIKGSEDNAVVCVGQENAEAYCKWVGGRLPTLGEWMRAARGASVQTYPWGSKRATCAQHPRSVEGKVENRQAAGQSQSTDGCAASAEEALVTKRHPAGAANESGMQDILITPAELLAGQEQSAYPVCSAGQHCLVYGLNPGSIDSVKAYTVGGMYAANAGEETKYRMTPEAYGFRCVVEK